VAQSRLARLVSPRSADTNINSGDIPSLADVSPRYGALIDRRTELLRRQDERRTERALLRDRLSAAQTTARRRAPPDPETVEQAQRVNELLGDLVAPDPVTGPGGAIDLSGSDAERFAELGRDIADTELALARLEVAIRDERVAASALVCERAKSKFETITGDLVAAAVALHGANVRYTQFAAAINQAGAIWSELRPLDLTLFGPPTRASRDAKLVRFLINAVEDGHLPPADLPADLRRE
jgi:hypothetical protein